MVDFYLAKGADGLTVLGVMGEAPKLTAEEARSYASDAIRKPGMKLSSADVADIDRLVARQTRRLDEIG